MFSLGPAIRAVRASTSLLRPRPAAISVTSHNQRIFHESTKARAVEAVEAVAPRGIFIKHEIPVPRIMQPGSPSEPAGPTQLNVRENLHKPAFYEAVAEIMKLRDTYIKERSIFIEGRDLLPLLLGLGADEADVAKLPGTSELLEGDPTLPFRKTRNCRFCMDFDTNMVRRLEFQPFILSAEEDFKRYDSGKVRKFDEIQNDLQLNSVFQALLIFKAMIVNGMKIAHRPKLQYDSGKWICTLFHVRTFTTPDILGEPALEGVHSDGVDHTMTTFLGAKNMTHNSAVTYMHSMDETTGIPLREISPLNLLARVQHRDLLDTLLVVDHERKHSLSAVYPENKSEGASRDMLVFFTRRPVEEGHISASMDSLIPHPKLHMEIPLFVPDSF